MLATLRPLLPYLRRYRRDFVWGGMAAVIANVIWIFFPQVLRIAIDDLNHGVTRQKIMLYAGLLVAISAAKGVFLFLTRWIIIGISREIEFDLRNDLFRHLEKQPAAYFQQHRTGDIMARMTNDLNAVRMLLGPAIMYSANTVLFSIGALYFLLRISPWLTLVALVPLPLVSILVQFLGRKIHERFERIQPCTRRSPRKPRRIFPAPGWFAPSPRKKPRLPHSRSPIRRTSAAAFAWFSSWACSGPRSNLCLDSPWPSPCSWAA